MQGIIHNGQGVAKLKREKKFNVRSSSDFINSKAKLIAEINRSSIAQRKEGLKGPFFSKQSRLNLGNARLDLVFADEIAMGQVVNLAEFIAGHGGTLQSANLKGIVFGLPKFISLEGADLRAIEARGVDFSHMNLSSALLSDADLENASFEKAKLDLAVLDSAYISGCSFKGASLVRADLSEAVYAPEDEALLPIFEGANTFETKMSRALYELSFVSAKSPASCFYKNSILVV